MLNPLRLLLFLVYLIGPFFWAMAKANLDVAYRVITGKIRPGIVRLSTGLSTDFGVTLLANSITLTPGTVTVRLDGGDILVHAIAREVGDDLASGEMDRRVTRLEASGITVAESAK